MNWRIILRQQFRPHGGDPGNGAKNSEPRNTLNTRKAKQEEVCFRVFRVIRGQSLLPWVAALPRLSSTVVASYLLIFCFLSLGNEEHFGDMNQSKTGPGPRRPALRQFGLVALCLLVCWASSSGMACGLAARCFRMTGRWARSVRSVPPCLPSFFGYWQDLNWLGGTGPSASPDVTIALGSVCGPLIFSKIYAPFALLFLGLSAWLCFRQWKLSPVACLLGGIAASLNSDFLLHRLLGCGLAAIEFRAATFWRWRRWPTRPRPGGG